MNAYEKDVIELILTGAAIVVAAGGFFFSLLQWKRSEWWKKAERLDTLIGRFEEDDLLQGAAVVLDWTERRTTFRGQEFLVKNSDALSALRPHTDSAVRGYSAEEATIRDAYDSFIAFMGRIEVGIASGLVDSELAQQYFGYWLTRFVRFDRHHFTNGKERRTPAQMVAVYVAAYGDPKLLQRLCRRFKIEWDPELIHP